MIRRLIHIQYMGSSYATSTGRPGARHAAARRLRNVKLLSRLPLPLLVRPSQMPLHWPARHGWNEWGCIAGGQCSGRVLHSALGGQEGKAKRWGYYEAAEYRSTPAIGTGCKQLHTNGSDSTQPPSMHIASRQQTANALQPSHQPAAPSAARWLPCPAPPPPLPPPSTDECAASQSHSAASLASSSPMPSSLAFRSSASACFCSSSRACCASALLPLVSPSLALLLAPLPLPALVPARRLLSRRSMSLDTGGGYLEGHVGAGAAGSCHDHAVAGKPHPCLWCPSSQTLSCAQGHPAACLGGVTFVRAAAHLGVQHSCV